MQDGDGKPNRIRVRRDGRMRGACGAPGATLVGWGGLVFRGSEERGSGRTRNGDVVSVSVCLSVPTECQQRAGVPSSCAAWLPVVSVEMSLVPRRQGGKGQPARTERARGARLAVAAFGILRRRCRRA